MNVTAAELGPQRDKSAKRHGNFGSSRKDCAPQAHQDKPARISRSLPPI
jgi:hypothetical protein